MVSQSQTNLFLPVASLLTHLLSFSFFSLFLCTSPLTPHPPLYCAVMMKRFQVSPLNNACFFFLFDSRSGSIFHERSFISQQSLSSHLPPLSSVRIPVCVHSWMRPSFVFILLFYALRIETIFNFLGRRLQLGCNSRRSSVPSCCPRRPRQFRGHYIIVSHHPMSSNSSTRTY